MSPLHLRAAGVSVLIAFRSGEAAIVHWGADLGADVPDLELLTDPIPHSAFDVPVVAGLLPQASSGWLGRPGLRGSRVIDGPGRDFSPAMRVVSATAADGLAEIVQQDADAGLQVTSRLVLHPSGLLEARNTLRNTGRGDYQLDQLAVVLPVPAHAAELLDLTGRWCRENHPQRQDIRRGTWVRTGRHGRTGHDSSLLFAAGSRGFGNRHGSVWGTHLAWSGDHELFFDALADGRHTIGAAELLGSGEVVLAPGEEYVTPALYASFSAEGIDGVSARFHDWFRARPQHVDVDGVRPRPVVLNTWEAVYFDHRIEPLIELADAAAAIGVERFVLDDGWFRGRRDDTAGLGDWYVDEALWPEGLTPLIEAVTSRGMEFGLWVEPEMVNLDSDVVRSHPEWIVGPDARSLAEGGRLPLEWRHQHVIDLVNPEAWQYVFERLDHLLRENDISYLKWDQNRDLPEHGRDGRPSVHAQTLAAYRLFAALKQAHPGVEIESCSSGGARVDLGILEHTDRVWASDCNDALERQTIQRWTQAVLPPELVGAHVGPTHSHTTGRVHDIMFRVVTALFGHFGIEWDIRQASERERDVLRRGIETYKRFRGLIHTGRRVNADVVEPALSVHGVVGADEALFAVVMQATPVAEVTGRVRVPGLNADHTYRVAPLMPTVADFPRTTEGDAISPFVQIAGPRWFDEGLTSTGRFLAEVGLPMPVLRPEQAVLLHFERV
ncbi:alpha-galactosidase [Microbacterium sp. MEC084]|uniref:alpha-galactosidase n=1 Tax=Microbacterium sp. MEC084 TaxID=1963027 RepID=UPI00106F8AB6|nr:alpha-galactosidase [Microbacterium sp. MEC084]MCD1267929.1 alpha-galactosidase [Microbacterium sp. MEC084]